MINIEILTAALVVITAIYAFLTWKIARSNDRMVKHLEQVYQESHRPIVLAYLTFRQETVVRLTVKNFGASPAYELQLAMNKDFYQFNHDQNVRSFELFSRPFSIFPPNYQVDIDLAQSFNFDKMDGELNRTPSEFKVHMKYQSDSKTYESDVSIDLKTFFQLHIEKTSSERLEEIVKGIEKLAKK